MFVLLFLPLGKFLLPLFALVKLAYFRYEEPGKEF